MFKFQKQFNAFTLAEVLIVLGIIGIIAELTIPDLYSNFQKRVAETKLEQAYSILSQAITFSETDNGPYATWQFPASNSISGTQTFYDAYFKPYIKTIKQCPSGQDTSCVGIPVSSNGINYVLANGEGFSMLSTPSNIAYIIIDINGVTPPNVMGKDVFYFQFRNDFGLVPYQYVPGMTRDQIINNGTEGCNSSGTTYSRYLCTALIMIDGWKISDDYPW